MTEEQKDRLRELINNLVSSNRNAIFDEGRWDCSRRQRDLNQKDIESDESDLETFIQGL